MQTPSSSTASAIYDVTLLDVWARVQGPAALLRDMASLYPTSPSWTRSAAPDAVPDVQFTVEHWPGPPPGFQIRRDGLTVFHTPRAFEVVPALEWLVNTVAVEGLSERYLLFHAGSAAWRDRGVILPAASGSGKSTLVAALAARGFTYLSDEVAVVETVTGGLLPFAKGVCIKDGSRAALAAMYPALAEPARLQRALGQTVWYLRPAETAWPDSAVPLRAIVVPRYQQGARTTLAEVRRSALLQPLLEQSFNARLLANGIGAVVNLLQNAACFTLTHGSLDEAVEAVRDLLDSV